MKKNISCIICVWIIITGVSAQILEAVMAKAKIEYEIKFYPWSRSYTYARERPNTFIFSISRISSREHLFKWVGLLSRRNTRFFH